VTGRDFLQLSVSEWLDALAAADPAPGGGSAAAMTAATAAAIVAKTARLSAREWKEAKGVEAQALALRARLAELAGTDAEVYADSLAALADRAETADERRDFALGAALERAAHVPLLIAETACDVALLAAGAAEFVQLAVQADAQAAVSLAAAAAEAAAKLVEVNLATTATDERARRARRAADSAAAAVQSAR
jgi:glutamate formiminotransferase/formiminotetrahydrofolate cyclodeaminase